jgi:hypothetical protein
MVGFGGTLAYSGGASTTVGGLLYTAFGRTAAEIEAGITPTNYAYSAVPADPRRYGAAGNWNGTTGTNDTAAVQAAVNATPEGGCVILLAPHRLSTTVSINKPITVRQLSAGSPYNDSIKPGVYPAAGIAAFTLVARTQNYAFGQYGIVGVHFDSVYCRGDNARTGKFITVDKTVNGGDFHIRECSVDRCIWLSNIIGVEFTGIAYLNSFNHNCAYSNTLAVKIERGTASDNGGQTRFYGGYYGLNTNGISLNIDTAGGDFGFHGVTISENTGIGLIVDEECNLYISPDCQFEANATCGIYCEIAEVNPNSSGQKRIGGKFISNGASVWINKTTTAFSGGGFNWPMKLDDMYFGDAVGLKIDVPVGHAPIDSPSFIIGRNTVGTAGPVASSQISANFAGTDERKQPYSKRISIATSYVSGTVFAYLPTGLVVTSARMYFTANCSGFSSISLGDQASSGRYLSGINGQTVTLNTMQVATIAVPQVVTDSTNNAVRLAGTGGWLSAAAVVEIEGYTT